MINKTEKLIELYQLIRNDYQGILTKEDISTIYYTISNRLEEVLKEEKEYVLGIDNGL